MTVRWRSRASDITAEEADLIGEAYFLCEQDRHRIGRMIGWEVPIPLEWLTHPLIRRSIASKVRQMRRDRVYSREEHVRKLQEIRDGALRDENWKVGLSAEVAVGRAAGLYENIPGDDPDDPKIGSNKPVEQLSNDQIRARLTRLQQQGLPAPSPADEDLMKPVGPSPAFTTPRGVEEAFGSDGEAF